ncbi:2'-5' RNA ligase family protein [Nocardia donostiensis]|uniref:2'-5' RNA ligase n=1 Tax=Nocardia donostiensis TaxID=1538463 RepID=A0A1W0BB41_9NOCA|nr:2'-5' RNA ligase family protein [Nocardia donostiensis]ONM46809.1 hypothetical protein B0T46_21450 [Nocardia donostiensis]OQS19571.1 hypothetical protein B0T44_13305 [Nocardia donostiensis]
MSTLSKRPFPLLQPVSIFDAARIRDNDWMAFSHLSTVNDHWSLKAWAPGQTGYYWYLTFDDPALTELVARCQQRLADECLDMVPLTGLHLTMLGIGKTSDVSVDDMSEIAEAARMRLRGFAPFDVTVGPLSGSRSAVRFSVTPWDRLLDLHRELRQATSGRRPGVRLVATHEFRPHIGIGYINQNRSADSLVSSVAALRTLPAVKVRVDRVDLVELRREERQYRWRDCAVIKLGA